MFQIIGVAGDYKINPYEPRLAFPIARCTNLLRRRPGKYSILCGPFRSVPEDPTMIRYALSQVDPDLSVTYRRSMIPGRRYTREDRLIADLALIFAILAVALASIGLYGITSYIAIQRTNEITIPASHWVPRVLAWSLSVCKMTSDQAGVGILLGIPFVFAAGYWMKTLLFDVSWYNLTGLNLAILFLILCSIVAELIPAYRAASVEPMKALRTE